LECDNDPGVREIYLIDKDVSIRDIVRGVFDEDDRIEFEQASDSEFKVPDKDDIDKDFTTFVIFAFIDQETDRFFISQNTKVK
jgi:hypothetical protein